MRLNALAATLLATAALAVGSTPAHATANLFSGSQCGGQPFTLCASWSAMLSAPRTLALTVTNLSASAPASNPNSVFTQIFLGNVASDYTLAASGFTTTSVNGSLGRWDYASEGNGFNMLLEDTFGADAQGNRGLTVGRTVTFSFTFAQNIVGADFRNAQIAFHDQGAVGSCASSKALFDANTGAVASGYASTGAASSCVSGGLAASVVPEPSTYLLLGTGILGLAGIARRRRSA